MKPGQTISAIVPARNEEANIAAAVRSLVSQPEIGEIVVVNDHSTDGTGRVLAQLKLEFPGLMIVNADPLPEGWVGKNSAVWQGARRATGEWLLFTDADAVHLAGSAAKALRDARAAGAELLSYSPEQELRTWWERALIPFVYCRLARLYSYASVNDPQSPAAAANGQYLLIRREAYDRIGGHAAVATNVLEDVALARLAKAAGVSLHFSAGAGIARVHMYESFAAMWEGWNKNLYPLVTGPGQGVTRELLSVIPWIPLLLLLLTPVHAVIGLLGLALLGGRHAAYAAALKRNLFPVSSVLYYLVAVALYSAALLASDWHYARGTVAWKGRQYAVRSHG